MAWARVSWLLTRTTFQPLRGRVSLGALLVLAATALSASAEALVVRRYLRHWTGTEKLCRYMMATSPGSFFPRYGLALEMEKQGRLDEAIDLFRQVLRMKPDYYKAWNGLGHAWALKGRYQRACRYFAHAVRLYPDYAEAHGNLAAALTYLGKYDQAVQHYEKALELKQDYLDARRNYAATLLHWLGQPDSAAQQYRQILALNPRDSQAHCGLGDILLRQGRAQAALVHYRAALRLEPGSTPARKGLQQALDLLRQSQRHERPPARKNYQEPDIDSPSKNPPKG